MIFLPQDIMYLSNIDFSNLIGVQMYELLKACLIYKSRLFSLSLRYDSKNIITHNLKKQETRSTSVQSLNECCFTHFEQWISGWSYDPNCVNFHFLFLPLSFFFAFLLLDLFINFLLSGYVLCSGVTYLRRKHYAKYFSRQKTKFI